MSFTVVDSNAEDMLYALLVAEEHKRADDAVRPSETRFLQCQFFHIAVSVCPDDIGDFSDILSSADDCAVYFCGDGDLIIKWSGGDSGIRDRIVTFLRDKFGDDIQKCMSFKEFFVDYDLATSRDKLKAECARKLKKQTRHSRELAKSFANGNLIATLHKTMQLTKMQRAFRAAPHILIVEDQAFSQKLLTSILKDYTCHIAKNAGEALLMYMEKCPDIVLLDIDLPDLSGHSFAQLVNRIDEDSYVVMVSANQYEQDIQTAKDNNVKGFVAKPYEKETILKIIEQYKKSRKRSAA